MIQFIWEWGLVLAMVAGLGWLACKCRGDQRSDMLDPGDDD